MVYERINAIAQDRKLALTKIEEMAGVGRGAIAKWKEKDPQLKSVIKVAKALGVDISDLVEIADYPPEALERR